MKKTTLCIFVFIILFTTTICTANTALFDMRKDFFEESRKIKPLMATSKDRILLSGLLNTCIVTITQLDSYFYMIGVLESVKKDDWNRGSTDYLISWLNKTKQANQLNIEALSTITTEIEPETNARIQTLKKYFTTLNTQLDSELEKITLLRKALIRISRRARQDGKKTPDDTIKEKEQLEKMVQEERRLEKQKRLKEEMRARKIQAKQKARELIDLLKNK